MSERLSRLAREHPAAFERVAREMGGGLENRLLDILDEASDGRRTDDEPADDRPGHRD